jgi:hypothetical protein
MRKFNDPTIPSEVRDLTQAEVGDVSGGSLSMIGVAVMKLLRDINFKFHGCTTSENGLTACSYSYDTPPGEQ